VEAAVSSTGCGRCPQRRHALIRIARFNRYDAVEGGIVSP
jgi:hypothetical protein